MLCITHSSTDPFFNLAAEEYLLHNFHENCFMLWQNENSIVVGKHQNTLAEINLDFVREKNIKVVRRLSGGGTVFHDLGNLNYTFIIGGQEGRLVNFKKYSAPILEVLQKLNVDAKFQPPNNLVINGEKFSGNAEHIYKNRVLHHGTLLFSSEIEDLNLALKVNPFKYKSKAVKSIPSRVTNIREHLKIDIDVTGFKNIIMDYIMENNPYASLYEFSIKDIDNINMLKREKYQTWEWNYGYSPEYGFERTFITHKGAIRVNLYISGGFIKEAKIQGDFFNRSEVSVLEVSLEGIKHEKPGLTKKLKSIIFPRCFGHITQEEFIKGLF